MSIVVIGLAFAGLFVAWKIVVAGVEFDNMFDEDAK